MREVRCIRAGPSYYAVVAGIFAALSAILTKLTFSSDLNFDVSDATLPCGVHIQMLCAYLLLHSKSSTLLWSREGTLTFKEISRYERYYYVIMRYNLSEKNSRIEANVLDFHLLPMF
uniref:Ig-like domain-containing protein n=1 Tax=Setaria digitata TaxID=48799 RepID=A0A915PIP0_9BILA